MTNAWIHDRLAGVPDDLAQRLREAPEDLASASLEALAAAERAVTDRTGSESAGVASVFPRFAGAEPLLVADALITYACEQALEATDPMARWSSLLERIGRESR